MSGRRPHPPANDGDSDGPRHWERASDGSWDPPTHSAFAQVWTLLAETSPDLRSRTSAELRHERWIDTRPDAHPAPQPRAEPPPRIETRPVAPLIAAADPTPIATPPHPDEPLLQFSELLNKDMSRMLRGSAQDTLEPMPDWTPTEQPVMRAASPYASLVDVEAPGRTPDRDAGLIARIGAWSAAHPWPVLISWFALAGICLALSMLVTTRFIPNDEFSFGEAGRADHALKVAGLATPPGEMIIVTARSGRMDAPKNRAQVLQLVKLLRTRTSEVTPGSVTTPTDAPPASRRRQAGTAAAPRSRKAAAAAAATAAVAAAKLDALAALTSKDHRSALINYELRVANDDDGDGAFRRIEPVLKRFAASHPTLTVKWAGNGSISKELAETTQTDFAGAERSTVPVTLLILGVTFGALIAALLPVILGLTSVVIAVGAFALISQISPGTPMIQQVILLVGMAVGVDYTMFYLRRQREERRAGRSQREALMIAAATSGRAVAVSGVTVAVSMAGMYMAGVDDFTSMATGTIIVVLASILGSLTVLPAMLALLGDRVDSARFDPLQRLMQLVRRDDHHETAQRRWRRGLSMITDRPTLWVMLGVVILVAMALPALHIRLLIPGLTDFPESMQVVQAYDESAKQFPGATDPSVLVVQAPDARAPAVQDAMKRFRARAVSSGAVREPITTSTSADHGTVKMSLLLVGRGNDDAAMRSVATLRDDVIPATLPTPVITDTALTGFSPGVDEFNARVEQRMPWVMAFVLVLTFLLMLATFRSVIVSLKTIVLNLLSVGAAYGIVVTVFQDGHGAGWFGFSTNGAVVSWLPLFLFVLLFALSMDYHVFILSRVRELREGGMPTDQAVVEGITGTAGTVSSAALVMASVFGIFTTLSTIDMQQIGFGLTAAIIIDATLVRIILLPATMRLLGEWNWWFPRWLRWLPDLSHGALPDLAETSASADSIDRVAGNSWDEPLSWDIRANGDIDSEPVQHQIAATADQSGRASMDVEDRWRLGAHHEQGAGAGDRAADRSLAPPG